MTEMSAKNRMSRDWILDVIRRVKPSLQQKYGVKSIGLFGSFAREEATTESDIDLLVEFDRPIGIEFVDLADEIELILQRKVDLVSRNGVKKPYLKEIEKDLLYA